MVSMLTVEGSEMRRLGLARRLFHQLAGWIAEEYRLTRFAYLRHKAENGEGMTQYLLGARCESGNGTFQSLGEAVKWYQKAAFQGVTQAQLTLGLKYLSGQGVTPNDSEALLWLRKAAEQGEAEAQYQLANLYREGRGTPRDLLQAGKWYRKAAEQGHSVARGNLKELTSGSLETSVAGLPSVNERELVA
jgi:TPR repeat protein